MNSEALVKAWPCIEVDFNNAPRYFSVVTRAFADTIAVGDAVICYSTESESFPDRHNGTARYLDWSCAELCHVTAKKEPFDKDPRIVIIEAQREGGSADEQ